jgi:hypothetical protein
MNPMTGDTPAAGHDLLDRFARALTQIVHDERPDLVGRTVTVAELYQEIAPYRRMRETAGFEVHGDYEHALLRFLAGEGGHAQLDPESAADELGIEAESADPDLSLYRKFAACDVRLALGAPLPPRPVEEPAPDRETPAATVSPSLEETLRALQPGTPHIAREASVPRCGFCGNALPDGRDVRYCPFCGADQSARACAECGEPLEDGWRFCVACGSAAES